MQYSTHKMAKFDLLSLARQDKELTSFMLAMHAVSSPLQKALFREMDGEYRVTVCNPDTMPEEKIILCQEVSTDSTSSSSSSSSGCNSRSSVHFPPDDSIITAIHTRPRTDIHDIPTLYYSSYEIKQFKHKYKNRVERRAYELEQEEGCCSSTISTTAGFMTDKMLSSCDGHHSETVRALMTSHNHQSSDNGMCSTERQPLPRCSRRPKHDNSFWRTKVNWRWQPSTTTASSSSSSRIRSTRTSHCDDIDSDTVETCNRHDSTIEDHDELRSSTYPPFPSGRTWFQSSQYLLS